MDYKDLEKKSGKELAGMLQEERGSLHDLRLKARMNQLKDVAAISRTKKTIARLLTKLRQTT